MSSRIEYVRDHPFNGNWIGILKNINSLDIKTANSHALKSNILRLKKAANYIHSLINEADFDLLPKSIWDNMKAQSDYVQTHVENYKKDSSENNIDQANGNIDEMLKLISPYVVNGKGAAIGAGKAFKKLASETETYIEELSEAYNESISSAETAKSNAETILETINSFEVKITELEEALFSESPENPGFKSRAETIVSELDEHIKKVETYKTSLLGDESDNSNSIVSQIENNKVKVEETAEAAQNSLKQISDILSELQSTHTDVFGAKDDAGNRLGGLKLEYSTFRKKLEDYRIDQEKIHSELNEQINQLLNDATTAGLATSYAYQKAQYEQPIKIFTLVFYGSLFGLFLVAFSSIIHFGEEGLRWS